jgi:hypothetical protein
MAEYDEQISGSIQCCCASPHVFVQLFNIFIEDVIDYFSEFAIVGLHKGIE